MNDPWIHSLLVEQGNNTADIAYHVNWPDGTDPWNLANPTDARSRVTYYGIWGVSASSVDGDTFIVQEDEATLRAFIESRLAMPSPLWMSIGGWSSATGDSVFMQLKVVADSPIGTGHVLHMALAECGEHWDAASPNGTTDFYSAMYKMYPSASGQAFTHSGSTSDTSTYVARFAMRYTGDVPMQMENIKFVAWVQNTSSKDILQSKMRNFARITLPHSRDTLYVNVPTTITWLQEAFTGNVSLEVNRTYPDGTWEPCLTNIENTGSAQWTPTGPASNTVRFRLVSVTNPADGDTSKGDFYIQNSTTLALNPSPITGTLFVGDTSAQSVVVSNTGTVDAHVRLIPNAGTDNYALAHSDDPDGPTYEWVNASTGTSGPTGDDATASRNLPFAFPFYGQTYTRVYVCTNGWLSFVNPGTNYYYGNQNLPVSGPNTFIAVCWDDLNVTGTGNIRTFSDTANHRVVIAWNQVQRYSDAATRINAEAILYSDGRIVFQYATMSGTTNSATVGVQNSDGSLFTQVWSNEEIPSEHAVRFDVQRVWARPLETTFTIPAGGTHTLPFMFDARNFSADTVLNGSWSFAGNLVPLTIPVSLTVQGLSVGDAPIPRAFEVSEAYPNPFNPTTIINLSLAKTAQVTMKVYTITGREVATLIDKQLDAGSYRQVIQAGDWATGMYFVKVTSGDKQFVRKLLLLK